MVNVGTYTGGVESGTQDTDTVYLLDGVEQVSAGLHPSFAEYYPTASSKKTWLTDRIPVDNIVNVYASENDEGTMVFLNDSLTISGTGTQIEYTIFNGTTALQSAYLIEISSSNGAQLPSATDYNQKLTFFNAYPNNLNSSIPNPQTPSVNPTWTHYDFVILSSIGAEVSNRIRVHKLCPQEKHKNTQLAWTNSVGGWDSVLFTGRTEHTDSVSSKPFRKQIGDWDASTYTFLPQARESQAYQVTGKSMFKLTSIDFSFADIELIKYAIRSDNLMMRAGSGDWMPVTIDTKSYNVKEAFSGVFSVSLTVTLAQSLRC